MLADEDLPHPAARFTPPPLDPLGVEELRAYIAELRREIARTEAAIERKQLHRTTADAFFKA